jgi:hypothetical protein
MGFNQLPPALARQAQKSKPASTFTPVITEGNYGGTKVVFPAAAASAKRQEAEAMIPVEVEKARQLEELKREGEEKKPLGSADAAKVATMAAHGILSAQELAKELQRQDQIPQWQIAKGMIPFVTTNVESLITDLSDVLGRLRSGAQVTAVEEERFKRLLPTPFKARALMMNDLNRFTRQFYMIGEGQMGKKKFENTLNEYRDRVFIPMMKSDVKPAAGKNPNAIKLD